MKGRTRITLFWNDERIKICECFPIFHYVVLFLLATLSPLTVVRYLLCFILPRIRVHMITSSFFLCAVELRLEVFAVSRYKMDAQLFTQSNSLLSFNLPCSHSNLENGFWSFPHTDCFRNGRSSYRECWSYPWVNYLVF